MDAASAVAIIGLGLAWALYRMERAATRHREIDAARAVLLAVKRGMVDGYGGEPGWGERYFARNWSEEEAALRGQEDSDRTMKRQFSQVLVVPTQPLHALIGSNFAGDLISEDTVFLANLGLWHLEVFNQFAIQQSQLLVAHFPDIMDDHLDAHRRYALAEAIGAQSRLLHRRGVGEPAGPDGWYRRLRAAVDADIDRLDRERRARLYPTGEARLAFGDALAAAAVVATVIVLIIHNTGGDTNAPVRPSTATISHTNTRP